MCPVGQAICACDLESVTDARVYTRAPIQSNQLRPLPLTRSKGALNHIIIISGRRMRVRPRRRSLSFFGVSPTKRRSIRKRNVKLASTFSPPKPVAQLSKSGIQIHDENEEDNGSERDNPDHYSQVHEELTSEDEECSKTSSHRKRQQRFASA